MDTQIKLYTEALIATPWINGTTLHIAFPKTQAAKNQKKSMLQLIKILDEQRKFFFQIRNILFILCIKQVLC